MRRRDGRLRYAAIVAATLVCFATPASPQSETPPIIGRTRSNAFCAMVRTTIAPVVAALALNDGTIATSRATFTKMSHDRLLASVHDDVNEHHRADLDYQRLLKQTRAIAKNLVVAQRLLDDDSRFPGSVADDEMTLAQNLRQSLRRVATQENDASNIIGGTTEADLNTEMVTEFSGNMQSSVAPTSSRSSRTPTVTIPTMSQFDSRWTLASDIIGRNRYDLDAAAIADHQRTIAATEDVVTPTVIAATTACSPASR